jgi:hypothetical protein
VLNPTTRVASQPVLLSSHNLSHVEKISKLRCIHMNKGVEHDLEVPVGPETRQIMLPRQLPCVFWTLLALALGLHTKHGTTRVRILALWSSRCMALGGIC